MPKTRNAFALRDFDDERILQRPFFREFKFPSSKTDEEILQTFNTTDSDSADDMEKKIHTIKTAYDRLMKFRELMFRHYQNRCDKYNRTKAKVLGVKIAELKRPAPVIEYCTAIMNCITLAEKFRELFFKLEKEIQKRYRQEFATRLQRARKAAGLTQKQLAEMIQISTTGFASYEQAKNDPSIPTLIRIAKVLKLSENQLLGLK